MVSIRTNGEVQPKAALTMKLHVPLFRRNNEGKFEKITKQYLKRNETYIATAITENYIQLEDNTYILDRDKEHYDIRYGEVIILGKTAICSRRGSILRYLEKGQKLKIHEFLEDCIRVGNKEFISYQGEIKINYL